MARLRTLNELSHLRETMYGQPYPRHGLILLWWFADECIEIDDDGNMIALYDPEDRDFGFHPFHNSEGILPDTDLDYYEVGNLHRPDAGWNSEGILPDTGLDYYEVGNLHRPAAMPDYVTKNYDIDVHESNADRIVVSVDSDEDDTWFDRIYVTHHVGNGCFDEDSTFRISQGLIRIIQNKNWSDFIREVKIQQRRNRRGRR